MHATILLVASYISLQIFSDIGSLRIVSLAGMSIDAGTFIYPLTFTLRDMVHKIMGKQGTRIMILTAAGFNLFMAGYFWLVSSCQPSLLLDREGHVSGKPLAPHYGRRA